jgi:hypothetical protein
MVAHARTQPKVARRGCGKSALGIVGIVLLLACGAEVVDENRPAQDPPAPVAQAASTRQMVARLAERARTSDPEANIFLNRERAALYEERLAALPVGQQRTHLMMQVGLERVLAGRPREGIEQFRAVEAELRELGVQVNPAFQRNLDEMYALAYLRLAELENCLQHHGTESCLVPLAGGGIHARTEGGSQALTHFEKVLRFDPTDLGIRWLVNLTHMTLGSYPDGVPEALRIAPDRFASEADLPRFVDVAPAAGLATGYST